MITVDGNLIEQLRIRMALPIKYQKSYCTDTFGTVSFQNENHTPENRLAIVQAAANKAYSLQVNQYFNDGNTRTALAVLYYILIKARKQTIKAPIYITYAQLGYYGFNWHEPQGFVNWVETHLYGPSNIGTDLGQETILAQTLGQISHIQDTVNEFRQIEKTDENRNNPHVRNALQKKRHGLGIMDIEL